MARRISQLLAGLALYGLAVALVIRSGLGGNPWDVLHQGLAHRTGFTIGTVQVAIGLVLLVFPFRQRLSIALLANLATIGPFIDIGMWLVPELDGLAAWAAMLASIILTGVAIGLYMGPGLGKGPRDGLMMGLVERTGGSVRTVRTCLEVAVLGTGWLLGGTVGIGTVLFALFIGPIIHRTIPCFTITEQPQ